MPSNTIAQSTIDRVRVRVPKGARRLMRRCSDLAHGYWPPALADRTLLRTTRTPETFNEKIRYRMAYDRRPILQVFADKVAVRDFVAERVGADYLTTAYGVYSTPEEVDVSGYPRQFVCKATHGSGASVIVWERAERTPLPENPDDYTWEIHVVHPDVLDQERLRGLCRRWLSLDNEYGVGRLPEWAYRRVPHRILVEELLETADGRLADDYKLLVFDGVVEVINVISARFGSRRGSMLSRNWQMMPVGLGGYPVPDAPPPRPDNLEEIVRVAEAIGAGIDFVRVDLYNVDGRIVFGEITGTPGGGSATFTPPSFDRWLGRKWTLPEAGRD